MSHSTTSDLCCGADAVCIADLLFVDVIFDSFSRSCEALLRNLLHCKTSMDLLQLQSDQRETVQPALDSWATDSELLSAWATVVVAQTGAAASGAGNTDADAPPSRPQSLRASASAGGNHAVEGAADSTTIASHGHLLLVLPLCMRLVLQVEHYGIRAVATEIVRFGLYVLCVLYMYILRCIALYCTLL